MIAGRWNWLQNQKSNTAPNKSQLRPPIFDCKPITKASNFVWRRNPIPTKPLSVSKSKSIVSWENNSKTSHLRAENPSLENIHLQMCLKSKSLFWLQNVTIHTLLKRFPSLSLSLCLLYSPCLQPLGGMVVIIIISGDAKPCSDKQSVSRAAAHMNPAAVLTERAVPPVQTSPLEA